MRNRTAPLDFLRGLRIKNAVENSMDYSLSGILRAVFSVGLVLLVVGCGEDPRFSTRTQYLGGGTYGGAQAGPPRDTVSYWDGDNASGSPSVKISLGEQRAYFYKSGVLVGVSQLSTGREGLNTATGTFKIIQKDKDHVSSLFGDYVDSAGNVVVPNVDVKKDPKPPGAHFKGTPMPYFMRIVSGTGMHAGYLPGYPASHGCIRMPEFMAENFFRSVSVGTPVTITH
jgi:lipoprotein-anchoring transpeptidase ErfK/SrfK